MNFRVVLKTISIFIFFIAGVMLFPMVCALFYGESEWFAFFFSFLITAVCGGLGYYISYQAPAQIFRREGFAIVGLGWMLGSLFGAMPYILTGTLPHFVDAYFETVSGFTTTGATTVVDIEILPKSIQFWRCMTNWLGGMGIIVLFVAIFPFLGVGGKQLFRSESSATSAEGIRPKIRETARRLWIMYLGLTAAEIVCLKLAGLSLFDAICHTFSTVATGGFANYNASVGYFNSAIVEWVIIFFMVVAGMNFFFLYGLLFGKRVRGVAYSEWKSYLWILFTGFLFVLAVLKWQSPFPREFSDCVRPAAFQVVSLMTTTGFVTENYELWPPFTKVLLVMLMFVGGCAGSTGGGMKVVRMLIAWKFTVNQIAQAIHPGLIKAVKFYAQPVRGSNQNEVLGFFLLSFFFMGLFTLLMALSGLDVLTAGSSVISTLWNIGPGLARVGAIENYAFISGGGKMILSLSMIMGRLEFFAIVVLFAPSFWNR